MATTLTPGLAAVVDARTGLVPSYRVIRMDPGSPTVFVATARMAETAWSLDHGEVDVNSGAGLSEAAAVQAAVGECIERACAATIDRGRLLVGSWRDLHESEPLVHPSEMTLFAEWQKPSLPRPAMQEESRLAWIRGTSLVTGRDRWAPAALVHIPYVPGDGEVIPGPAISTGLACWHSRDGAIMGGLCECIERDAVAITWLNRRTPPRLNCDEPWAQALLAERFLRPNLHYGLFYLRTDINAPTVLCLLRDDNFDPPLSCVGGACRLNVRDALRKALIECVQGWTWARHERLELGSSPTPADFENITSFGSRVRLYACTDMSEALSFLAGSTNEVRLSEFPARAGSHSEMVGELAAEIDRGGSDAILIELTTPEIEELGFRAVKVYCPSLEQLEGDHRYRLLGGSRWRNVPERLGWGPAPAHPTPWPHPYP